MKLLKEILLFTFIAITFASCGSDDDPDYTLNDISPLRDTKYLGKCVMSTVNIKKDLITIIDSEVELIATSKKNTLALRTTECGLISGDILVNFKNTPDETAYTFDIKSYNVERTGSTNFVNHWFGSSYDEIESVLIKVNSTTAKYTRSTGLLTFKQKADVTVKGKVNSYIREEKFVMEFDYTVIEK